MNTFVHVYIWCVELHKPSQYMNITLKTKVVGRYTLICQNLSYGFKRKLLFHISFDGMCSYLAQ